MRRAVGKLIWVAGISSSFAWADWAFADETAAPCAPDATQCERAPIAFSKEIALPVMGGFDTGWVPSGSAIQVHLVAELYANSKVDLAGTLDTAWPDPLTLATQGTPGAGNLGIHYGVDIEAEAHLSFSVFGQNFNWTGPIPYVPQFDYQVDASTPFDPWAFTPVVVDGTTMQATLVQVSATDFIGVNIPGLDGGFELDTSMDLKATYKTSKLVITYTDGTPIEGGPIGADGATTLSERPGPLGAFIEYDVHPEGTIVYDGTLHLIPAFYIDTIGPDFSIPVADIPIPFSIEQKDWIFDPVRVHVPLPDVSIEGTHESDDAILAIDLGEVDVGDESSKQIGIGNDGEASLAATFVSSDPAFHLSEGTASIVPGGDYLLLVKFHPTDPGEFTATVDVMSNDPDEPVRTIQVHGTARDPADGIAFVQEGGACGCKVIGEAPRSTAPLGLGLALAAAVLRRRRRKNGQ